MSRRAPKLVCEGTAVRKLTPGQRYMLAFKGYRAYAEPHTFVSEYQNRDNDPPRRKFRSEEGDEWEAYKFEGRWAYGTGAEPLTVYPEGTNCWSDDSGW